MKIHFKFGFELYKECEKCGSLIRIPLRRIFHKPICFSCIFKNSKLFKVIDADIEHIWWCYNRLRNVYGVEHFQDLEWLYDTLINDHGENKNYDFMIRLKEIIRDFRVR